MYIKFAILSLIIFSTQSLAHSGHDHSDISAGFIHLLWATPIIIVVGLIVSYVKKELLGDEND